MLLINTHIDIIRHHIDIKLVTTEGRRNYLVSEPNYHVTKVFSETLFISNKNEQNTDTHE